MADELVSQEVLSAPVAGRIVNDQVLLSSGVLYSGMARAFSGQLDPASIWAQMIGNAWTAIELYRELEAKDDTVGDAVDSMKRSVLKRNISVVPLDETNSYAADIAKFIQSQFDALPNWRNTLDAMLDAPYYGYSVAEQVFDVSAGQVSLLDLRDCPQEMFRFGGPLEPQTGQLRLLRSVGATEGELMPEHKFAVWSSRMRAGDRRGRPLLREVFWPSWFNRNVLRFWMRLVERGPGTAVVNYPDGAKPDEKSRALAAAEALVEQIAIAVPEGMQIRDEFLKTARSTDPAAFEKLSDRMESKIIRRIEGSTLTSKGSDNGAGTQALGDVHAETKEERSVEMALQLQGVVQRQIVQQLVLWNFGPDAPMCQFLIDTSNETDLGKRITVDKTLQSMGKQIPISYVVKTYGVPEPGDGDEVLVPPAGPASSIDTPAGPPDHPQFSADPTITHQVNREQAAFDQLLAQMKTEGRKVYRDQVRSVATQAAQGVESHGKN